MTDDEIKDDGDQSDDQNAGPTPEDRARELGWKSEDEWKGAPPAGGHVSAEQFLERAHTAKLANDGLRGQISTLEAKLDALHADSQAAMARVATAAQKKYERDLAAIKAEKIAAKAEDDIEAYAAADAKEAALEAPVVEEKPVDAPSPEFAAWKADNDWYAKDGDLKDYADFISSRTSSNGLTERQYFDAVAAKVKEHFPDKFRAPRRPPGPEGGGSPGGKGKGWADVPAEDRRLFEGSPLLGTVYTNDAKGKAEFAKDFFEETK